MCARVRACVRACVRVCVCVCYIVRKCYCVHVNISTEFALHQGNLGIAIIDLGLARILSVHSNTIRSMRCLGGNVRKIALKISLILRKKKNN